MKKQLIFIQMRFRHKYTRCYHYHESDYTSIYIKYLNTAIQILSYNTVNQILSNVVL